MHKLNILRNKRDQKLTGTGNGFLSGISCWLQEIKLARNTKIKRSLFREGTKRYVGALAALSVFLNAALASFLPFLMVSNPQVELALPWIGSLFLNPEGESICNYGAILCSQEIDISSQKLFVFVASSIPILVFGKILPKYVGLCYPHFYSIYFNSIARIANSCMGWVSRGVTAPVEFFQNKSF
jgi:CBS domain containing-hemolysin-like protein